MTARILLMPGLGGHPVFHRHLISSLARKGLDISSAPHGDFFGAPFRTMEEHTRYWRRIVDGLGADRLSIIGISYGAHVALSFSPELISRLSALILISYWPIGALEQRLLKSLGAIDTRLASRIVGRFSFLWSDRTADDLAELRKIRRHMYDSRDLVYQRLLSRLLCLRSNDVVAELLPRCSTSMLYGRSELGLRLHRRELTSLAEQGQSKLFYVAGGHEISTSPAPALAETVGRILTEEAAEKMRV